MRFQYLVWLFFSLVLAGCGGGGGSEEDAAGDEAVSGLGGRVTIQQTDGMIEFLPCKFEQSDSLYVFFCGRTNDPPVVSISMLDIPTSGVSLNFNHIIKPGEASGKYRLYQWKNDKRRGGSVEHDRNARTFYFTMVDASLWIGVGYEDLRIGQSAIIHGKLTY